MLLTNIFGPSVVKYGSLSNNRRSKLLAVMIFRFIFCRSRTCKDIDECATNDGKGDCEYACANTDGSFRCSCPAGYSIGDDGLTCYDIDECQVQNGQCSQKCENKPGSHTCDCFDGFVNLGENVTDVICIDIGKAFKKNVKLPFSTVKALRNFYRVFRIPTDTAPEFEPPFDIVDSTHVIRPEISSGNKRSDNIWFSGHV